MKKLNAFVIVGLFSVVLFLGSTASAFDNLTPTDAYDDIMYDDAYILDVRTAAEFIWVGHPHFDDTIIDSRVVNISYKIEKKDEFIVNPSFVSDVNDLFEDARDTHIITMCRSGQRSQDAATVLEAAGYTHVSNMLDGFEGGGKDIYGYRTVNGWKNSGLPGHTSSIGAGDYYKD